MNRSASTILAIGGVGTFLLLILYLSALEKDPKIGPVLACANRLRVFFHNSTITLARAPTKDGDLLVVTYEREGEPAGPPSASEEDAPQMAGFLFQNYAPGDPRKIKSIEVTCRYVTGGACSRSEVRRTWRITREEFEKMRK